VGGNIKSENEYGAYGQVSAVTVPHREGDPPPLDKTTYGYGGISQLSSVTFAEGGAISYVYDHNHRTMTNTDGHKRRYTYQEDGRIIEVMDEDTGGQLTVATTYGYDALGRLITITQGVQTRSFTFDNLGRLKSETHPESGTVNFTYDANSNLLTKTDARAITTTYTYDELNRVTQKAYSDSTPWVTYFYDSQPSGNPITTMNPVGRLTRVSTTASGVTNSSYYSYCNCSSIDSEATVITDGTTKTYITSYTYNYVGGIMSMTYPNGKVVTYTRDDVGRETKASSTVLGQPIDYVRSASYLGPSGQVSEIDYGIMYGGFWVSSQYSYSPKTLRLTFFQTYGLRETLQYGKPGNPAIQTGQIYDIVDEYHAPHSQHFDYDSWYRLTGYWKSWGRDGEYERKNEWTYDRYNNMTTRRDLGDLLNCGYEGCLYNYYTDAATNRLSNYWWYSFSYDSAGNETSDGKTYDAENRLTWAAGQNYLYDGNSRRMRALNGSTKIYFIYSAAGKLITEDNWTAGTTKNSVYFNGQLVATHTQDDYVRFHFSNYAGTITSVVEVTPEGGYWPTNWQFMGAEEGAPFQGTKIFTPSPAYDYQSGLQYYGARYYSITSSHWTSPDPVTGHAYDPQSLNKYTYVRNDPVNNIDPDGKQWRGIVDNGYLRYWERDFQWGDIEWTWFDDGSGGGSGAGGGDARGGGEDNGSSGASKARMAFDKCLGQFGDALAKQEMTAEKYFAAAASASRAGGDIADLLSLWANETGFKTDQSIKSAKGAIGSMQLMPNTIDKEPGIVAEGEDPRLILADNLAVGLRYYNRLIDHYGISTSLAASAYNAGPYGTFSTKDVRDYQKAFDGHRVSYGAISECITRLLDK
jgi:RHS repeat-associated protein